MHYQQGGGKYPIHVSEGGGFASREEKLGEMHLFRENLHSCICELFFRLNFSCALLPMVPSPLVSP
jgi:hypothetical protein